jgi:hypothetical protein
LKLTVKQNVQIICQKANMFVQNVATEQLNTCLMDGAWMERGNNRFFLFKARIGEILASSSSGTWCVGGRKLRKFKQNFQITDET